MNLFDILEKSPVFNVYATINAPYRQKFELQNVIGSGKKTLHREKGINQNIAFPVRRPFPQLYIGA